MIYIDLYKRLFDFLISLIIVTFLLPFFVLIGMLIKLSSKGPVFFVQQRLGKNYKAFNIYKFRTMTDKPRELNKEIFKGNNEVTILGSFLRRFKIDELPQLYNILIGDMSLVGPRPCLLSSRDQFDENAHKRVMVRPGLTGLAQINGNIYLSWQQRWKLDREYVETVSFSKDCMIIFKTFLILVFGEQKFKSKDNE